ncbi:MAG: hypothetical protein KJ048_05625 [Dehalococcoidia bacterium]|nr:hypothetical protein [Dehalococcoidia bacterium]
MPLFSRLSVNRRVERLIREGVGVRESTWTVDCASDPDLTRRLTESIVGWVRHSMGEMRRPYGIDHVALALACRDGSGRVVCSTSLGVLRPISFYGEGPVAEVNAFLGDVARATGGRPVEMVGALLSLGDIAFALNGRPAAA